MTPALGRTLILLALLFSTAGALLGFAIGRRPTAESWAWLRRLAYGFAASIIAANLLMVYAVLELQSLLDAAEPIVVSALARQESRGAHYRSDFPARNDQRWLRHSLIRRTPEGPALTYEPVTISRFPPK